MQQGKLETADGIFNNKIASPKGAMRRAFMILGLLFLACLLAGVYGALHDQVTYQIAPEYFTRLKFQQFGVSSDWHPRVGAAIVGFLASWWAGCLFGIAVFSSGMLIRDDWVFFRSSLIAICLVLGSTILAGLIAYLGSFAITQPSEWQLRLLQKLQVEDTKSFLRVGMIHNASYLGGLLGTGLGIGYQLRRFWKGSLPRSNELEF